MQKNLTVCGICGGTNAECLCAQTLIRRSISAVLFLSISAIVCSPALAEGVDRDPRGPQFPRCENAPDVKGCTMLTPNPETTEPPTRSTLPMLAQSTDRHVPPGRRGAPNGSQGGGTRSLFEVAANAEGFVFTPKPNPVPRQTRGSGTRFALKTPRDAGTSDSPKTAPKGDPKAPIKSTKSDRQPIA